MRKVMLVTDMQNDFVRGSLGTKEAEAIIPNVIEKVKNFDGEVIFTRDTHYDNYPNTLEGKNLPVSHCVKETWGWDIIDELKPYIKSDPINKITFGSVAFGEKLHNLYIEEPIESITFIGVCTGICVLSNVIIAKAFLPNVPVIVDAKCCACVTPESHKNALEAMKTCQIIIENE